MPRDPSLTLFFASLVIGLGFGLGYALMTWLVGKVTGAIDGR